MPHTESGRLNSPSPATSEGDLKPDLVPLSEVKRRLLEKVLRGELSQTQTGQRTIPRHPRDRPIPLSFAQQQLWFLAELAPGTPVYNEAISIHRVGALDTGALSRSLNEIVRRHEAWRTTFATVDGQPAQIVQPAWQLELPVVDLRGLPETEREAESVRLATEDARRPFDLIRGPLLRATLVRLGDEEHRLFLSLHHIVFDGVSINNVFVPELLALYEAFSTGNSSPLPELAIQYADFADWQRQRLSADTLSARMAYWRQQLGGAPETLELPTDRSRSSTQTFRGAQRTFALSTGLTESLRALSRREGVTLFMTLLAAFKTLLFRYTGQEDIVVGSITAGRDQAETEKLIGLFLNELVLRTDLSGNPSFRELLGRVREVTLGALNNEVPFGYLVKELQPRRDPSRNPLFQVLCHLEPPLAPLDSGWNLTQMDVEVGTAKFDLDLDVDDRPEGVIGRFIYNTDLFEAATIARIAANWRILLEEIAADPGRRIAEFSLLTEAERRQVLVEWNQTEAEYPREKTVHRLFEEQVERAPEAVAVEFEGQRLTYCELNRRSNQLARYLRGQGVGPEVLVGFCVERSLQMVVGLLGILKAGGAYLPLDPAYPSDRLRFMLEDAGITLVLTQGNLSESLPERSPLVRLDAGWAHIEPESGENFASQATSESLAYVIYTSGSTGKPKGVEIEHGSLVNYVRFAADRFGLQTGERILQFASLSFDTAAQEIFSALSGRRNSRPTFRGDDLNGCDLSRQCRQWNVQVLHLPTSYWHELVRWLSAERLSLPESLRLVVIGGERALPERFARWREMASTRIRSSTVMVPRKPPWPLHSGNPTAGRSEARPADGADRTPDSSRSRLTCLTHSLQPVPVGVVGELYIGGAGLARGYRNRPEMTAEKFIPDPFRGGKERLYRTGDQVRFRPDGVLEYLGRVDRQIKLRGFRVEPGEIEAHCAGLPGCARPSCGPSRKAGRDAARSVCRARAACPPSVSDLRQLLTETLPAHMVPANFVFLGTCR